MCLDIKRGKHRHEVSRCVCDGIIALRINAHIITSTRAAEPRSRRPGRPQRETLTDEVIVALGDGRVELGREGGLLGRGEGGSRAGEGEAGKRGLHLVRIKGGKDERRGRGRKARGRRGDTGAYVCRSPGLFADLGENRLQPAQ